MRYKRLGTEYIDLLWVHAWDPMTPVEEFMRALDGIDDARNDSREVLASNPDFTLKKYAAIQPYKESQIQGKVMDMLQKAGLE